MTPNRPRLLIVDQSLRDLNGHHFEYDVSVARAAKNLGLKAIIAGNIKLNSVLDFAEVETRRHFEKAWNEVHQDRLITLARHVLSKLPSMVQPSLIWVGSMLRRTLVRREDAPASVKCLPSFGAELSILIAQEELTSADHVFVHTLSMGELHSTIVHFKRSVASPLYHIVLRRDADDLSDRTDGWGGVGALFQTIAETPQLKACFRFYADTDDLCVQYRSLSHGLPVRLLPIPHQLADPACCHQLGHSGPIRITYLGNARTEKGFQYLPDLVAIMKASHIDTGRVKFVIQANSNMSLEEGTIQKARRRLTAYTASQVELLEEVLSLEEFQRRIVQADLLLLPYDSTLYRRRSSGIMVQALVVGCPVIVPSGTWMSKSAPAGASVAFEGYADLARACIEAVEALPALRGAAALAQKEWGRFHNAEKLVQNLLSQGNQSEQSDASVPT